MSESLPNSRVEEAIRRLPKRLREDAQYWWNKRMKDRRGSETYARQHPQNAVNNAQRKLMFRLKNVGKASYREIESIMHLRPASGNDSLRCITAYENSIGKKAVGSRAARKKPRLTLVQVAKAAREYAELRPKATKAAFRPVLLMLSTRNRVARREKKEEAVAV